MLSGFELYPRWVPLSQVECWLHNLHIVYVSRVLSAQFSAQSNYYKRFETCRRLA